MVADHRFGKPSTGHGYHPASAGVCAVLTAVVFANPVLGQAPSFDSLDSLERQTSFRLPLYQEDGGSTSHWDVSSPVRMRAAEAERTGEVEIKNIFGYSTSSEGDDELEYELEVEWGFTPNHHLIFELPVEIGDGEVEGNADITLG